MISKHKINRWECISEKIKIINNFKLYKYYIIDAIRLERKKVSIYPSTF